MASTHPQSCTCFNCRSLRISKHVETPPTPGKPLDMGLDDNPDELSEEQILTIKNDPLAVAIALKENDASDNDISNVLSQAGFRVDETVNFMDQADAHMQATRRG